jgi:hypothetical protein
MGIRLSMRIVRWPEALFKEGRARKTAAEVVE